MRKEKARAGLRLRLERAVAIAALALCLAAAACNGKKLYAPEGSIQERLHDLDYMCRAYLFEGGSFTLNEDFEDYAPQIARFCLNEARRLDKICDNPGKEFNERDIQVLQTAMDAVGELALAIEDALVIVDPANPHSRVADAPKYEYAALKQVNEFIEKHHRNAGGSEALYK